ncbi:MAG: uncharacterized protein HW388_1220 [Dehalococcoidia bacterium]|nr:uncharacterized protein [Dehalococcoidia bacterium]
MILVALAAWGGVRARNGIQHATQAGATVRSMALSLETFESGSLPDIALLQGQVALVDGQLREARSNLTPFLQLSPMLGWVPRVGPQLKSARDMLDLASSLTQGSRDLLTAVEVATSDSSQGSIQLLQDNRFNEDVLRTMAGGEPFFSSALGHLEQAMASLERLEGRELPPDYLKMVTTAQQLTPELETFARTGLAASQLWQTFFGYETPQTYLLVAQNSDELRATGGFIPGAWLLTLDHGEITQLQFWDTVEVDNLSAGAGPPLPPEGLLQAIWAGAWLFRDAGWYPDFPTSARVMEQMFKLGQGTSVDGVITLDQWAVQGVLAAMGPTTMSTGETLDETSYMKILEDGTDLQSRRFMDTLLEELLDTLREEGSENLMVALLATMNKSLEEKHILLFLHNPALQEVVTANGWDGALTDSPGDYLMVVDSNVGFSKVNRNIAQRISYQVDLSAEGKTEARLDILYTNQSQETVQPCGVQTGITPTDLTYYQLKNACYWDYLRVYGPEGSALQTSSPFPMPEGALYRRIGYNDIEDTLRTYSESGKAVFAGFFNLGVGESRGIAFVYTLPDHVVEREEGRLRYSLLLQSQPGTQSIPVELTLRLPAGYCVQRASPEPSSLDAEEVRFAINLDSDTTVQLVLERKAVCKLPSEASPAQVDSLPQGRTRTAFASLIVEPVTESAPADHIQMSPQDATLIPRQRFLFTAIALDSQGKPVRDVRFRWRVKDSFAGAITSSGLLTAGLAPGTYLDAVEVSVISAKGTTTATASVTIVSREQAETRLLSSVVVYPADITVRPGQVVGLGALGWDEEGRFVQNLQFKWSIAKPSAGSVDQLGFFTASQASGPYPGAIRVVAIQDTPQGALEREAFVSVTVSENARRGVLSRVVVVPGAVTINPGQRVSFITRAFDESGQRVSNVSFIWEVTQPVAGQMEKPGQFVASALLGRYADAIRVVATQETPELALGSTLPRPEAIPPTAEGPIQVKATIAVTIAPPRAVGNLAAVRLTPGVVTLRPGQLFVFGVSGLDSSGNLVPATVSREVVDPAAGSISQAGVFTAGREPGMFKNAVRVQMSQEKGGQRTVVEAFATVNILGPLERVEISPSTVTVETGQPTRLRAVAYDANGLEIPALYLRWSVEDPQAGSIDESGVFTAGAKAGRYENAVRVIAVEVDTR